MFFIALPFASFSIKCLQGRLKIVLTVSMAFHSINSDLNSHCSLYIIQLGEHYVAWCIPGEHMTASTNLARPVWGMLFPLKLITFEAGNHNPLKWVTTCK